MSLSGLPFDDIRSLFDGLPGPSPEAGLQVQARNAELFGDPGMLAGIGKLQQWLAEWSGTSPAVNRPLIAVFAATHGASAGAENRAVSDKVNRIAAGGAPVNQLCAMHDVGLKAFDLALAIPTGDIRQTDALSEQDAAATMAFGMEAVAGGIDLLCLSDCSAAASSSPASVFGALYGGGAGDWAGDESMASAARTTLERIGANAADDPLELMRRAGGREICALAGAILAARVQHVPVVLEGAGALSAAALLKAVDPGAVAHCRVAQPSVQPVRQRMIGALGLEPVIASDGGLEEGEGSALAAAMLRSAAVLHSGTVALDVAAD